MTKLPFSVSSILTGNTNNHIFLGGRVYHDLSDNIGIFGLNPNGSIDSSFGANGLAEKDVPGGTAEVFFRYILTRDANGRFLVSGGVQGGNFTYQFSVTRFTKKFDSRFPSAA